MWPDFDANEEGLEHLTRAIERAGFVPGKEIGIAIERGGQRLEPGHAGRQMWRHLTQGLPLALAPFAGEFEDQLALRHLATARSASGAPEPRSSACGRPSRG